MKIVGIGDLFIPEEYIQKGFKPFEEMGVKVCTVQWDLKGSDELQNINLLVEQGGIEAYEPPGKDYPIVTLDNVTITPHLAGGTVDVFLNSPKLLAGDLIKLFKKEILRFVLNKNILNSIKL